MSPESDGRLERALLAASLLPAGWALFRWLGPDLYAPIAALSVVWVLMPLLPVPRRLLEGLGNACAWALFGGLVVVLWALSDLPHPVPAGALHLVMLGCLLFLLRKEHGLIPTLVVPVVIALLPLGFALANGQPPISGRDLGHLVGAIVWIRGLQATSEVLPAGAAQRRLASLHFLLIMVFGIATGAAQTPAWHLAAGGIAAGLALGFWRDDRLRAKGATPREERTTWARLSPPVAVLIGAGALLFAWHRESAALAEYAAARWDLFELEQPGRPLPTSPSSVPPPTATTPTVRSTGDHSDPPAERPRPGQTTRRGDARERALPSLPRPTETPSASRPVPLAGTPSGAGEQPPPPPPSPSRPPPPAGDKLQTLAKEVAAEADPAAETDAADPPRAIASTPMAEAPKPILPETASARLAEEGEEADFVVDSGTMANLGATSEDPEPPEPESPEPEPTRQFEVVESGMPRLDDESSIRTLPVPPPETPTPPPGPDLLEWAGDDDTPEDRAWAELSDVLRETTPGDPPPPLPPIDPGPEPIDPGAFNEALRYEETESIDGLFNTRPIGELIVPRNARPPEQVYLRVFTFEELTPTGFRVAPAVPDAVRTGPQTTALEPFRVANPRARESWWTLRIHGEDIDSLPLPSAFVGVHAPQASELVWSPASHTLRHLPAVAALEVHYDRPTFDGAVVATDVGDADRLLALFGDPAVDARLHALALEIAGGPEMNPERFTRRAILFLQRRSDYQLATEIPPGPDPVLVRWLENACDGFCEHFAGAFVLLARAYGIPARTVAGFALDDYDWRRRRFNIYPINAHAWAEILVDGQWLRIEPTPAARLFPERPPGSAIARFEFEATPIEPASPAAAPALLPAEVVDLVEEALDSTGQSANVLAGDPPRESEDPLGFESAGASPALEAPEPPPSAEAQSDPSLAATGREPSGTGEAAGPSAAPIAAESSEPPAPAPETTQPDLPPRPSRDGPGLLPSWPMLVGACLLGVVLATIALSVLRPRFGTATHTHATDSPVRTRAGRLLCQLERQAGRNPTLPSEQLAPLQAGLERLRYGRHPSPEELATLEQRWRELRQARPS